MRGFLGCFLGGFLGYFRERFGAFWGYLCDAGDGDGHPVAGVNLLTAHGQRQRVQGDPGGGRGVTPNLSGSPPTSNPKTPPGPLLTAGSAAGTGSPTPGPPPPSPGGCGRNLGGTESLGDPKISGEPRNPGEETGTPSGIPGTGLGGSQDWFGAGWDRGDPTGFEGGNLGGKCGG